MIKRDKIIVVSITSTIFILLIIIIFVLTFLPPERKGEFLEKSTSKPFINLNVQPKGKNLKVKIRKDYPEAILHMKKCQFCRESLAQLTYLLSL